MPYPKRQFASDNYAGCTPEAWQALEEARHGHARGYGDDQWTAKASDRLREIFETDCDVFFVFNGTAANSLALSTCCQSYHSILCHEMAHVETDECGAPEFFSNGTKVLLVKGENGKINRDGIGKVATQRTDLHFPRARAVSITQSTEMGTVYTVAEIEAIAQVARELKLRLHMDGARFANAVASLQVSPAELTWKAGVDVLCFGGTKQGLPMGEAIVFFNKELAHEFDYRCKQAGQLASKMRFLSAPWLGMLKDDAWLRHAGHANAMAHKLHYFLKSIPGVKLLMPRQSNAVFAELPRKTIEELWERGWSFYTFIGEGGCRFMCSWDTQSEDVDNFVADIKECIGEI